MSDTCTSRASLNSPATMTSTSRTFKDFSGDRCAKWHKVIGDQYNMCGATSKESERLPSPAPSHVHTAGANSQQQGQSTRQTSSECAKSLACRATEPSAGTQVQCITMSREGEKLHPETDTKSPWWHLHPNVTTDTTGSRTSEAAHWKLQRLQKDRLQGTPVLLSTSQ